jgi:hypothetical protein
MPPVDVGSVFDKHSQAGDNMEKSSRVTGKRFMTRVDEAQLRALVGQVFPQVKRDEPFLLPDSLFVERQ